MKYYLLLVLSILTFLVSQSFALEPIDSQKGSLLFEDDFNSGSVKPEWQALHGTRWSVEEGAFVGIPSTPEFQASRDNHTGATPSMTVQVAARDCILEMSFKVSGGLNAAHIGFNNSTTAGGTGHIARLIPSINAGTILQKDRHSQIIGDKDLPLATSDWTIEKDRWYTVLIEVIGDQCIAQIDGGPTLKAKHWRFDVLKTSLNLKARGNKGTLSYDNVKIWEALPTDGSQVESGAIWKKHTIVSQVESTQTDSAVANDFDGDGFMDVIGTFDGNVVLLKGPDWKRQTIHAFKEGDSSRKPRPQCIHSCLLDVDGDGDQDFVGSNNTTFWLECPKDPFSGKPWKYHTIDDEIQGTHCLITGDVNQDGKLDLIANSFQKESATTIYESICWFETPAASGEWVRHVFADKDAPGGNHYMGFGDINGDGRPDISCGAKGGEGFEGGEWFAWWEQPRDPTQVWKKHLLSASEPGATNIIPADVNRDGVVDLVASRGHGNGLLLFMGPDFHQVEVDADIYGPHSLVVEDFDQDGDVDIASCGRHEESIAAWFENDGRGFFTKHLIEENQGSYDTRAVDMDRDGDLDLLIAGHWSRNILWYENPMRGLK
ncbi:MAG: VCBS repeat-containing protein [Verrucomicrobia bacterium]|nr:VCBS repeat-containing protein [Verrucomicrobiota bacterium]MDA1065813.1 VCBS repeat-containing protein [Verrucomicrobiota bacterium]